MSPATALGPLSALFEAHLRIGWRPWNSFVILLQGRFFRIVFKLVVMICALVPVAFAHVGQVYLDLAGREEILVGFERLLLFFDRAAHSMMALLRASS